MAKLQPEPEPSRLEFYRVRDRFVRSYAPATEEERLLVDHMVRSWLHLQSVYEMKDEIAGAQSLAELFNQDLERYRLLDRSITGAERMWRHASESFYRARRRRESRCQTSTGRSSLSEVPSVRPEPTPAPIVPGGDSASAPEALLARETNCGIKRTLRCVNVKKETFLLRRKRTSHMIPPLVRNRINGTAADHSVRRRCVARIKGG